MSTRVDGATRGAVNPTSTRAADLPATHGGGGASTMATLVLTGAALTATADSRVLGKQLQPADGVPVQSGTDPAANTPPALAKHSSSSASASG